ncbi:hypothetical protein M2444_005631 [Paenibacillus sp. PastF-3]|uniref:hypothetical protein n=1 Tax=unclassified Paenibacillus TaxID=185978 RepID=UPI0024747157|nr:hypothetical protein [Paenibacillus sp. PastF-3]MDH6373788.1 hypothetical protein [Paenibacillus sp. PastF-3]
MSKFIKRNVSSTSALTVFSELLKYPWIIRKISADKKFLGHIIAIYRFDIGLEHRESYERKDNALSALRMLWHA